MFESAYLKVDRAKKHIRDLPSIRQKYANAARVKFHPDGSFATVHIDTRAELDCAVVIGDAVHNLRAALDHAFWELMGIDGGKQDRSTSFPIHRGTRQDYEGAVKGIPTPRQDTKDFLIRVGAYADGPGDILWRIHNFDIRDKHALLTPVFGLTSLRNCVVILPDGTGESWDHIGGLGRGGTFVRADGTAIIYPFDGVFEIRQEPEPAFDIHFGDIDSTEFEPVTPLLEEAASEIGRVLRGMERLVAART